MADEREKLKAIIWEHLDLLEHVASPEKVAENIADCILANYTPKPIPGSPVNGSGTLKPAVLREGELRKQIFHKIDHFGEDAHRIYNSEYYDSYRENVTNEIMQLFASQVAATEKAYGGCRNCYGKGYATVNDRWAGSDEWTREKFSGGDANAMKFCTCDRGKQLEVRFEQVAAAQEQAK